jgi:bifunctional DNA-binding transcriptional regulator/antitoxin component of YhaV-PrlF toxin-antitoxin module
MTNTITDFSKLIVGQRYIFQRKKLSFLLKEKTFEGDFVEIINVNNQVRIVLSRYKDETNDNPDSKVSMPFDMIEYIIKHPSYGFELKSYDSFGSVNITSDDEDEEENRQPCQENQACEEGYEYYYINMNDNSEYNVSQTLPQHCNNQNENS